MNTHKKLAWCVSIGGTLMSDYTRSRRGNAQKAVEADQRKTWEELSKAGAKLVQVELVPLKAEPLSEIHPVLEACAKAFKTTPEAIMATFPNTSAYKARCASYMILVDKGYTAGQAAKIMQRKNAEATRAGVEKCREFIVGDPSYARSIKQALESLEGVILKMPK